MFEKFTPKANKKLALGLSALALAASVASEAGAQANRSQRGNVAEQNEGYPYPVWKLREKVVKLLHEGKLPNRVLEIAITFTVDSDDGPAMNFAPKGEPDLIFGDTGPDGKLFFLGTDPRYLHYNGDDWLVFSDTNAIQANHNARRAGIAGLHEYTMFMNLDNMPKDAKVWVSGPGVPSENRMDGKLHPAYIDKYDNIFAKDVSGGIQVLQYFESPTIINNYLKSNHMRTISPSKIKGLK